MRRLEILKQARGLISSPENWTQGQWERRLEGRVSYCAIGAVQRALGHDSQLGIPHPMANVIVEECLAPVIGKTSRMAVASYNDSHPHECVLAMFDAAIEREEAAA